MSPRQRYSWHPGGKTRPLPIFRAPEVCWTQLSLSWYSLFPLFTHFSPWGSHVSFSSAVADWLDLPLNLIKHKSHIYVPPMGSGKFWRCTPRSASSLGPSRVFSARHRASQTFIVTRFLLETSEHSWHCNSGARQGFPWRWVCPDTGNRRFGLKESQLFSTLPHLEWVNSVLGKVLTGSPSECQQTVMLEITVFTSILYFFPLTF